LLIPIAREFQDALLITSRKTAGCNDSLVRAAKRQAMTNGRANTYPAAYTELAPGEPTSEGSLCGFGNAFIIKSLFDLFMPIPAPVIL
jgi:hypothetical protein